jgi:hypothetical protein
VSRLVPLELRFKLVGLGAKSGFGVSGEVIFGDRKSHHGVKHSRPPPSGLNLGTALRCEQPTWLVRAGCSSCFVNFSDPFGSRESVFLTEFPCTDYLTTENPASRKQAFKDCRIRLRRVWLVVAWARGPIG